MARPARDSMRHANIEAVRAAIKAGEWITTKQLNERLDKPIESMHLCDLRKLGVLKSRKRGTGGASHVNQWALVDENPERQKAIESFNGKLSAKDSEPIDLDAIGTRQPDMLTLCGVCGITVALGAASAYVGTVFEVDAAGNPVGPAQQVKLWKRDASCEACGLHWHIDTAKVVDWQA
jgi:hypothetical protein